MGEGEGVEDAIGAVATREVSYDHDEAAELAETIDDPASDIRALNEALN